MVLFELEAVLPSPSDDAASKRASSLSVVERGSSRVSEDEWEAESVREAGWDGSEGLDGEGIAAMTGALREVAALDDGRVKPFASCRGLLRGEGCRHSLAISRLASTCRIITGNPSFMRIATVTSLSSFGFLLPNGSMKLA